MSVVASTILAEDVRSGLTAWFGGNHTRAFAELAPPFSFTTFYRAMTGKVVGKDVAGWLKSRWWGMTLRTISDGDLEEALEVARLALIEKRGRGVPMEDLQRELRLFLRD